MVVALIALFSSLGGVSYAVAEGSIGSREIKNNAVQSSDVRDGSVQGRDITNGSVQSRDIRDGALRGIDVNDRSLGGSDLASNTLGDREIDETKLDIQTLGGLDAGRYLRGVQRVQTQTAADAATTKARPAGPLSARQAPARRGCPGGRRSSGDRRADHERPQRPCLGGHGYATAPTGNWQLVAYAVCG